MCDSSQQATRSSAQPSTASSTSASTDRNAASQQAPSTLKSRSSDTLQSFIDSRSPAGGFAEQLDEDSALAVLMSPLHSKERTASTRHTAAALTWRVDRMAVLGEPNGRAGGVGLCMRFVQVSSWLT